MGTQSHIEWTEATWNPLTGCTKVSPGCAHCYAERLSLRLKAMGQPNYANGFQLTLHEHMLEVPLRWKKPQAIFVNSMSDLFHAEVPEEFILRVFDVMGRAHWHRFQVLTKRPERLAELDPILPWKPNVWMGVTVENRRFVHRIDLLRQTGAHVKFLSLEPLLGPLVNLRLDGIDWAIVGGESGPKARPIQESWVLDIRDQCRAAGVAFFFKQWGGVQKSRTGRLLEGRTWDEMPRAAGEREPQLALPLVG
jgi:protein gp37